MDRVLAYNGKLLSVNSGGILGQVSSFSLADFADIGDIYADLNHGDKVGFVLRHSEREESGARNLTPAGIQYALQTGAKFTDGIVTSSDDIVLYSSSAQRCIDTARYIAEGTGFYSGTPEVNIDELLVRNHYEVTAPSTGWEDYSLAAYGEPCIYGGVFANIPAVTASIYGYLQNKITKKLNFFITHDQQLEMFTVTMCQRQIGLRFWSGAVNDGISERRWITYLAGMAIIKRADGSFEYYPVKSLDRGFQRDYNNIYIPG